MASHQSSLARARHVQLPALNLPVDFVNERKRKELGAYAKAMADHCVKKIKTIKKTGNFVRSFENRYVDEDRHPFLDYFHFVYYQVIPGISVAPMSDMHAVYVLVDRVVGFWKYKECLRWVDSLTEERHDSFF